MGGNHDESTEPHEEALDQVAMSPTPDYDVVIIGSGFGGSVAALRAAEKGYSVLVLEAGRRFEDKDFAKNSWHIRDFLFAPSIGCTGIQRIHMLPDVIVLAGAGVGGGSLVYANTMYEPSDAFFKNGPWADITDWKSELAPFYDQARRMLGVVTNPTMTPADVAMKNVAEKIGVGSTFQLTPVAVHFGDGPGVQSPDPYFGGVGPARLGCRECGECMTGCRHNAKNTLVKNYLALAERIGVQIRPLTTVTELNRVGSNWHVSTKSTRGSGNDMITATHVVVAAGAYGTQALLHHMKSDGKLPRLSNRLGYLSRTNSESLVGAVAHKVPNPDLTHGVAITSSFFPDDHTHVEPCRYGVGSNVMGFLATVLPNFSDDEAHWKSWLKAIAKSPVKAIKSLSVRRWSQRTVIGLVMQTHDNSITVVPGKSPLGNPALKSRQGEGTPNPTWIPVAHQVARELALEIEGEPMGNLGEVINAPFTAHFVGGCTIGVDETTGVVDAYHRAFGYDNLHILDGSTISGNLGVNPSLTITAQAERAMSLWPNKGEQDSRPAHGSAYVRIAPTSPHNPVVPVGASGELRLA